MAASRKKNSLDELYLGRSTSKLISETSLNFENPPKLYMGIASPPCRAVLIVAAALEIPLELIEMNILNGDHLQPDYIEKNPQHTIPTLEDNGFIVWESHAICCYLVSSYGRNDELYPQEPRRRALIDQRLYFNSSMIFVRLRALITPLMMETSKSLLEDDVQAVEEALDFLEKFLENNEWLAGDTLTIADLCTIANVTTIDELLPIDSEKHPNICEWMEKCKSLPYYEESNETGVKLFGEIMRGYME